MRTHRVSSARSRSASSAGLEATRASSSCPCPTPPCLRLPALQRAHTTLPAAEEAAKAAWQQRRQWPEAELLAGVRGCLRVEMGLFVSLLAPAAPPRVARLQAEGRVAATAQLQEPVPTKRRTQHRLASPARSPARTARRLRAARGRVELPRVPGGVKKTKHSPAPPHALSSPRLDAARNPKRLLPPSSHIWVCRRLNWARAAARALPELSSHTEREAGAHLRHTVGEGEREGERPLRDCRCCALHGRAVERL
jgi:hypothetical protein